MPKIVAVRFFNDLRMSIPLVYQESALLVLLGSNPQ
ncbi:hypothetical protein CJA_0918 [Cellvibrio japonicus Ueda107]|uniref:Uncharacterized protein n=1 Tax=Cellvibrio japonicus (strain Ueda107) TaxID=498211 RepID=B3PL94_CELJU|nr:hypothetical protein CJA_0918 [Cellvibrio japonicus Ueda107]